MVQPDASLARQLALDDVEAFLSHLHLAISGLHRESLRGPAAQAIQSAQKKNRERYFQMLRSRTEPLTFEVQPGDYVLVADRIRKGLAPAFIGPFRVIRITAGGNVVISTDDAGTHRAPQQWKVKPSRLYPYRFSHQPHDARAAPAANSALPP
jgi:hypothetical protein